MPLRDFHCNKCGNRFERLFKTHKADELAKQGAGDPALGLGDTCPRCGYKATRVLSKTAPPKFEGRGFYSTDYK